MGEVYRAVDVRLERDVAVKILASKLVNDPEAIERFEREAKAVASLSHPNILAIHDFDRQGDVYFITTEFLTGDTLRNRMSQSALSIRKVLEIAIAVAEGLAAAHSKGVVHRDLKPENIFLTADGQIKILDFGLAAVKSPKFSGQSSVVTESQETEAQVLGTVGYMSPEQIRAGPIDTRSDLFSFGCILYELLTGHGPFTRETVFDTLAAVLKEEPPELAETGLRIPIELQHLVHHCLEKNVEARAQSAHDVAFQLRTILNTRGTSSVTAPIAETASRRSFPWLVPLLALLFAGVLFLFFYFWRSSTIRSIAVLPFYNASGVSASDYVSDGLAESVISDLARIPDVRVMARSTVFHFKASNPDPRKIGRELKVDSVLTGVLQQRNNELIIDTELIRVSDGSRLWGENYHGSQENLVAIEEEILNQVLAKMGLHLTSDQQERFAKSRPENKDAYRLYLKGRYSWNKRTPDGLKEGIAYFQQAIEKDPTYAPAYAGLADGYALLGNYDVIPKNEALQKAKGAATRALEIDPQLPEAHTSLAYIYFHNWQWGDAEKEFKQAIELKPGYSTAHHWYANLLQITGRQKEGIAELRKAQDLDPLSLIINVALGVHLYAAKQYDEAIGQLQSADEMLPQSVFVHETLGQIYGQKGMHQKAIEELLEAVKLSQGAPDCLADLAYAYAISGRREDAQKILTDLIERQKREYVSPVYIALIYTGLAETERALEWLQRAYEERSDAVTFIKVEPRFDAIRKNPGFQRLLRQMGL